MEDIKYIRKPLFDTYALKYVNTKKIQDDLKIVQNILQNNKDKTNIYDYSFEELNGILIKLEDIDLDVRTAMSYKSDNYLLFDEVDKKQSFLIKEKDFIEKNNLNNLEEIDKELSKISLNNSPIEIDFDGKLFKLYTPLTFKRSMREKNYRHNYYLSSQVEAHIKNWKNEHEFDLYKAINSPYILVLRRVDFDFSLAKNCDNDNLENQKIINTITKSFSLPDNALFMSLYVVFDKVSFSEQKPGMYFYLFSQDNFEDYKHLFLKQYDSKAEQTNIRKS